jgi:polysaccharide export outer membrane protein
MKLPCGLLVSVLALVLSACATDAERKTTSGSLPPPPAPPPAGEHYTIRPGDLLTISFAGEPTLTQQVRVDWNGLISVPILAADGKAEVKAAGSSPSRLAERISETARSNQMLVNARAQVLVMEYAGQAYAVLGQVAQPGRYTFPKGVPAQLPIEEAVALAGGCTRLARQSKVLVKRGTQVYEVNLERLASQPDQARVIIIPGDVITVPERRF